MVRHFEKWIVYKEVISRPTAKLFYTRVGPTFLDIKKIVGYQLGRSTKRSEKLSIIKPIKGDCNSNKSSIRPTSDEFNNFFENLIQELDQTLGTVALLTDPLICCRI